MLMPLRNCWDKSLKGPSRLRNEIVDDISRQATQQMLRVGDKCDASLHVIQSFLRENVGVLLKERNTFPS
ncbi:hypothetical protein L596_026772 [Steinernema carpocapsae]|uniref:Uncharacterized protein n=1 Tax=Steinernema carpocapsae TaxID=34508 RepID=A0A4U5M2C2_STECR|nr:hypothetical protein L596_026772 [Steinernema carpocapsae]